MLVARLRGGRVPEDRATLVAGYFCVDDDTTPRAIVFNRTVSLRDTWARIAQKQRTDS